MRLTGTISRLLAPRIVRGVLLALLVIEAIFIAESLTSILERVLRFGGASWHVGGLLVLTSPEIFDFALPLAMMIGVYLALVGSRDDSEFIVSSAAGASWIRIPAFVMVTGLAGAVLSLLVAGYVAPLAATAKRLIFLDLQTTQIREQISDTTPRDSLRTFAGRTFISTSDVGRGEDDGRLFIRHPPEAKDWRVTQAKDWRTQGPDANGVMLVTFANVQDYAFDNVAFGVEGEAEPKSDRTRQSPLITPEPAAPLTPPRFSAIGAETVSLPIYLDRVIGEADRLRQQRELTLSELVGAAAGANVVPTEKAQYRAGEMLGRAMLCPLACLIAFAAFMAARSGLSRYLALPIAGVGVLAFDTVSRPMLGAAAENGFESLALHAAGLVVVCTVPLVAAIVLHGERVIRPAEGRA